MSNNVMEFNLLDDYVNGAIDQCEFLEFNNILESYDNLMDTYIENYELDYYNEEVKNQKINAVKNTIDTTKSVASAANDITDIGGGIIKGAVDLIVKVIKFISNIIKFLIDNIKKIPSFIKNIGKNIAKIPEAIRSKIRGDIQLYITINDIQVFYTNIYPNISGFINTSKQMFKTEKPSLISQFFNIFKKEKQELKNKITLQTNDQNLNKTIQLYYNKIKNVKFNKTTIQINKPEIVNIYFGNQKINFKNAKNQLSTGSYYEVLEQITTDMNNYDEFLKIVLEKFQSLENKKAEDFNIALGNFDFQAQSIIINQIKMMNSVIGIIGNINKSIIRDMNTINKHYQTIIKNYQ